MLKYNSKISIKVIYVNNILNLFNRITFSLPATPLLKSKLNHS